MCCVMGSCVINQIKRICERRKCLQINFERRLKDAAKEIKSDWNNNFQLWFYKQLFISTQSHQSLLPKSLKFFCDTCSASQGSFEAHFSEALKF